LIKIDSKDVYNVKKDFHFKYCSLYSSKNNEKVYHGVTKILVTLYNKVH